LVVRKARIGESPVATEEVVDRLVHGRQAWSRRGTEGQAPGRSTDRVRAQAATGAAQLSEAARVSVRRRKNLDRCGLVAGSARNLHDDRSGRGRATWVASAEAVRSLTRPRGPASRKRFRRLCRRPLRRFPKPRRSPRRRLRQPHRGGQGHRADDKSVDAPIRQARVPTWVAGLSGRLRGCGHFRYRVKAALRFGGARRPGFSPRSRIPRSRSSPALGGGA
jgi:hypothetical protein